MEKKKLKILLTALIIIILIAIGIFSNYFFFQDKEARDFELDTLFLRVAVNENQSSANEIKIINTGEKQSFSVKVLGLEDIMSVREDSFELKPWKDYTIEIILDSKGKEPGVYLGELEISGNSIQKIPIILEIQTKEILFDANVNLYPQSKNINPGKKLNAEIKIFDLASIGRDSVKLAFFVKSFDGRTIISQSKDIVVDSKADHSESIDLPNNMRLGDYVVITIISYEESIGTSSVFFKVVEETDETGFSASNLTLVIIIFGFFFLVFLGLFIYSIFYRDKLLLELQKQYQRELRHQREIIAGRVKADYARLKSPAEKKEYKKEIAKIRKERLKALRDIQNKRLREFRKIKKKGKKSQLKKKIDGWKKRGYDTSVLEKKYKMPNVGSIKRKVSEWKKKGYDTSVLEKRIKVF